MKTTQDDLIEIYDELVLALRAKLKAGTITGTELSELRKILEAGAVLTLAKTQPGYSGSNVAPPLATIPFPQTSNCLGGVLGRYT